MDHLATLLRIVRAPVSTNFRTAQSTAGRILAVCTLVAFSACLPRLASPAAAAEMLGDDGFEQVAQLLPETTIGFVYVPSAREIVDKILNHPLRERVEALPEVERAKKSKQYTALVGGVALFEASMTMAWPDTVATLSNNGLFLAADAPSKGAVMLAKGNDPIVTERFIKTVISTLKVANKDAKVKEIDYDRFHAYSIDDLVITQLDNWLLLTNKSDLAKSMLDRYITIVDKKSAPKSSSLGDQNNFQSAAKRRRDGAAWAYLNIEMIRESGTAPELYSGVSENILAEAIFGGILSNLEHTPHATANLTIDEGDIGLSVSLPHEQDWIGNREYFFGTDNAGESPPHLAASAQIGSLTAYRDLAQMWLRAGDLLTDKAADELATADSTLSTFFSGRDFGEDILGGLAPEIQLVVSAQEFPKTTPTPAVKLPAFALQFHMLDPEKMQPDMRRVFISLFGFLNVVGAMEGQPQLDFSIQQHADGEVITTQYIPPDKENAAPGNTYDAAVINYNFSPSVGFVGDRIIVSSSGALARELMEQSASNSADSTTENAGAPANRPNTSIKLSVPPIVESLRANREQLIAQNMLEKGHERQAAESEIDLLLTLLSLINDAQLELRAGETLSADVELNFSKK
ncbi:MAG: hypothetical protein Aurels2KO_27630 [Aureliella sp.]